MVSFLAAQSMKCPLEILESTLVHCNSRRADSERSLKNLHEESLLLSNVSNSSVCLSLADIGNCGKYNLTFDYCKSAVYSFVCFFSICNVFTTTKCTCNFQSTTEGFFHYHSWTTVNSCPDDYFLKQYCCWRNTPECPALLLTRKATSHFKSKFRSVPSKRCSVGCRREAIKVRHVHGKTLDFRTTLRRIVQLN